MREKVCILIIEDTEDLAKDARRELEEAFSESEEIEIEVKVELDFERGFDLISQGVGDVVVLDVLRNSPELAGQHDTAGRDVYHRFRETRFAPVVFWTALPDTVINEVMEPIVTVVTKDDTDKLPAVIRAAIDSRAVTTIKNIEQQVATELRRHMWTEMAPYWDDYIEQTDPAGIAPVLLSRLARVLDDDREQIFTTFPSHRYIYPPASDRRAPGDILRAADQTWWVILTPACDFAQNKAEYATLAKAAPLVENSKHQEWEQAVRAGNNSNNKWKNLEAAVLASSQGRFHYLPKFRSIPDLVVDLQMVKSIECGDLHEFDWVASLASPFAEALLIRYSQYIGRIGVPDLALETIKARLQAAIADDGSMD